MPKACLTRAELADELREAEGSLGVAKTIHAAKATFRGRPVVPNPHKEALQVAQERYDQAASAYAEFEQSMAKPAEGVVYVIASGNAVKIGFTARPVSSRVAALQTGSATPIELIATQPGTRATERLLHRRFASARLHGEWFRREGMLAAWIKRGCPL